MSAFGALLGKGLLLEFQSQLRYLFFQSMVVFLQTIVFLIQFLILPLKAEPISSVLCRLHCIALAGEALN